MFFLCFSYVSGNYTSSLRILILLEGFHRHPLNFRFFFVVDELGIERPKRHGRSDRAVAVFVLLYVLFAADRVWLVDDSQPRTR